MCPEQIPDTAALDGERRSDNRISPARSVVSSDVRFEDARLLTGAGRYVADIQLPRMASMAVVRSPVAHGRVRSINLSRATALDGVIAALDADQLQRNGVTDLPIASVLATQRSAANPVLARDKVLYTGQPIAAIVAEDPYVAEDAAELVDLEIEELQPVTETEHSLRPDSPILHEDWGTNIAAEASFGGEFDDATLEEADVIVRRRFRINRQTGLPLEARGAVAVYDEERDQLTAWISTQSPHHLRDAIATVCGWPQHAVRVIAPDVGGAFGTKEYPYAEEILVCLFARTIRRPVRWIQASNEHFLSTVHAREQIWDVELHGTRSGEITGIRGKVFYDVGGHLSANGIGPALQSGATLLGPYAIPNYHLQIAGVVTNKVPAGAYRGFGVPQAAFVMESLVDEFASEIGLDRVDIRRRNLIEAKQQPYRAASGERYDGGDYRAALERAVELVGWHDSEEERQRAASRGRRWGIGLAVFVMPSGLAPSAALGRRGSRFGAYSTAVIRMDPDGRATVFSGTCAQGQGTRTTLAQIAGSELGIDPAEVRVVLGDTERTPVDPPGSISSRVTSIAGGAVVLAAREIRDKLRVIAAHLLEANVDDVVIADGRAVVRGSPSSEIPVAEVARAAHLGHNLPEGCVPGLEAISTMEPKSTAFPYGVHAATVEVDSEETGAVRILRYVVVQDSGKIVNPLLANGQIIGALAQGFGGAMLEQLVYGDGGEPLTASYMDYLVPTAAEVPEARVEFIETPAVDVPGGMKGVGESGIVGPAAVIGNAVADALGRRIPELPLDPDRIRSAPGRP